MQTLESRDLPPVFRRSRTKIWIRTVILTVFGILFGIALYGDIKSGPFRLWWALAITLASLPVGYWLRTRVPMQVHEPSGDVLLSFDPIYFALILLLVGIKAVAGNILQVTLLADTAMCVILGLMIGRLSGICLRVRSLRPNPKSRQS